MMSQAVFLDLLGTLGGDGLSDIRSFAFCRCAAPALRILNRLDFLTIVLTNQSHIEPKAAEARRPLF